MVRSVKLQCLTVPISSMIPVYIIILLLTCFILDFSYCLSHLDCSLRTFPTTIHALFRLLLVFCTHHSKDDGNACAERDLLNAMCYCVTDNDVMAGCSLHHTPKADQYIIAIMSKHSLSYSC